MYIGNSPASVGNYQVVDDISSTFNGVLKSFALTASSLAINPAKSGQLLVSINGVLQEPDDTGTEGFKVSGSNIVFSSAPATSSTFWAVFQGQNVDIGTPSDGTVGTAQMSYPLDNFTSTGIDDNATSTAITIDASEKILIGDVVSHTTDLLQIETPASGGGHGIQIRRNDSNTDQNVGHILFGNNTATDLASISAKTDGATDSGAILFNTSVASGANTERLRIDSSGIIKFASTTNYGNSASYPTYPTAVGGYIHSYVNGSGTTYPRFLDIVCVGEGDGSKGGNIRFLTSPNGSTAAAERMRIESDGRIKTTECVYTYSGVQVSAAASTNYTLISGVPIGTYLLTVEGTGVYHYGGLFMYRHFDSGDKVITEIGHSDYQTTMTVTNTSNTYNSGNVIVNSNRALGNLTARLTIMGN